MSLRHGRTSPVERSSALTTLWRHDFWETFPQQHCRRSSGSDARDAVWPSGTRVRYQIHPLLVVTGVKGRLLLSPKVHSPCFADVQLEAVLLTPWEIPLFNQFCESKNEDHPQNPVLSAVPRVAHLRWCRSESTEQTHTGLSVIISSNTHQSVWGPREGGPPLKTLQPLCLLTRWGLLSDPMQH